VRWQVVLPAAWVPLHEDGTLPVEWTWVWRDRLIGTRPAASVSDLDHWLRESDDPAPTAESESFYDTQVRWRPELEPVSIRHARQQAWLLGCSIGLLAAAFSLYLVRLRPFVFWALCLLLACGVVALSLLGSWTVAAVLYGCEPGLAALLLIAAAQWLLHHRYRRQVVFLPSFKRLKAADSSLSHNGGSNRPREPSTVDAAPPAPSALRAPALERGLDTGAGVAPFPGAPAQLSGSSQTKKPSA